MSGGKRSVLAIAVALLLLLVATGWYLLHLERVRAGKEHYQYDLDPYRKVNPDLIRYREAERLPTGLRVPRGIAVDTQDRIVVTGDEQLVILGSDGKRLGGFAISGKPGPVAVSGDDLFVGLGRHLEVYSRAGKRRADWTSLGEKALITSVAVSDSDVFIADYGNRVVWRFARSGALRARLGEKDAARKVPGLIVPSPYLDVVVASKNGVWVANTGRRSLELYSGDGALVRSWGKASVEIGGFSGCCNPSHVALLPDGSLVTSEKGLVRIKVYDVKGKLNAVVAGPQHFGKATEPLDVAVDSKGRILALDTRGAFVRVFEKIRAPSEEKAE